MGIGGRDDEPEFFALSSRVSGEFFFIGRARVNTPGNLGRIPSLAAHPRLKKLAAFPRRCYTTRVVTRRAVLPEHIAAGVVQW
jgi:hypothetical protein